MFLLYMLEHNVPVLRSIRQKFLIPHFLVVGRPVLLDLAQFVQLCLVP